MKRSAGLPVLEVPRERFTLSCGATLLVSPRSGAPVTAVRAHVRGGTSLDPEGKEGLAFLCGLLADQGTGQRSEQEISSLLEPAGGVIGGDANGLGGTIAGPSWKLLLELLAELLTSPSYPKREVERQKKRLLTRILVDNQDPRSEGGRRFKRLVYGDHWIGRPAYGTLESIESIRPADLRKHHRRFWCGARTLISVCGDVDPKAVRRVFDRALEGWSEGKPYEPQPPFFPKRSARVDAFRAAREQVHLYLGHLGVPRSHPDYPALTVMDHVMGTGPGFTNRIARRLRDELGLAYTVSADIHSSAGLLPGFFRAYIGTSREHVATSVEGFLAEIRGMQAKPIAPEELEIAKSYLLGSFALGFERASRRASHLVSAELHGFPDDYLKRLPEAFAQVTVEDVQRVAQEHLFPDACCLAGAGPLTKRELKDALAAHSRRKRSAIPKSKPRKGRAPKRSTSR